MDDDQARLDAAVREAIDDQARAARGLGLLLLSMTCAVVAVVAAAVVLLGGRHAAPVAVAMLATIPVR